MRFMTHTKTVTCLKNVSGTEPIFERMTSSTGVPMYFGIIIKSRQFLLDLLPSGTNLISVLQGQTLYLPLLQKRKQVA